MSPKVVFFGLTGDGDLVVRTVVVTGVVARRTWRVELLLCDDVILGPRQVSANGVEARDVPLDAT